jgi:hypothetical protein
MEMRGAPDAQITRYGPLRQPESKRGVERVVFGRALKQILEVVQGKVEMMTRCNSFHVIIHGI